MRQATSIYIGRQSKYRKWLPGDDNREEILAQAMGRSGGLRAPTLQIGKDLMIGFSEEMYNDKL